MRMHNFIRFVLNIWYKFPQKLRFLLVGGFNTLVSYAFFASFIFILGDQRYQLCLVLAWVLSSFSSFAMQKIFVFCTKGKWCREYFRCCVCWVFGYVINAVILEAAVNWGGWNVYPAQAAVIVVTTVVTYLLFKNFAFRGCH